MEAMERPEVEQIPPGRRPHRSCGDGGLMCSVCNMDRFSCFGPRGSSTDEGFACEFWVMASHRPFRSRHLSFRLLKP